MRNLIIDGNLVRLEEVRPEFFKYIIEWRNNPDYNKFLNQSFRLTLALQEKWYNKYLGDKTQGLFVMVDKKNNVPFGTFGWTNLDCINKECIEGRLLVGNLKYRSSAELLESVLLQNDYLYRDIDIEMMYIHIVDNNKKVISFNKRWGYKENLGLIHFPNELLVNGMKQTEYYRTKEQYMLARKKIVTILESFLK